MADGPEKKAAKKSGAKKASSAKKAAPAKKAAGAKKAGAKKAAPAKKAASSSPRAGQPTHEQIAQAAYHRWERDGGEAEKNWLDAERELSGGG